MMAIPAGPPNNSMTLRSPTIAKVANLAAPSAITILAAAATETCAIKRKPTMAPALPSMAAFMAVMAPLTVLAISNAVKPSTARSALRTKNPSPSAATRTTPPSVSPKARAACLPLSVVSFRLMATSRMASFRPPAPTSRASLEKLS